jgi:hypothetical protein
MSSVLSNLQPHEKSISYLNAQKIDGQHINMKHVNVHDDVNKGYKYFHTLSSNTAGSVNTISVPPSLHLLKYAVLNFKVQGASQSSPVLADGFNLLARDKAIEIVLPGVSSNLTWSRNALRLFNMEYLHSKDKRDLQSQFAGDDVTLSVAKEYSFNIYIPLSCHDIPFPRYLLNDMKILTYFSNNTNLYSANATTPLIISSKMIFYYNAITNDSLIKKKSEPYTIPICEPVTRQYAYTTSNTQLVPIVLNGLYQNNELQKIMMSSLTTATFNADEYYGLDAENLIFKVGSDILYEYHEQAQKLANMFEYKFDDNNYSLNGSNRFFFTINTSLDRTIDPKEMFSGVKLGTDPILEIRNIDNAVAQTLDVHAIYKYVLEIHQGVARILK